MNVKYLCAGVVTASVLFIGGCGQSPQVQSTNPQSNASSVSTPAKQTMDAKAIVDALAKNGMPISKIDVYTADNDPNKLLGRPGQYTSKVNFVDKRVDEPMNDSVDVINGGSVEVFANDQDAKQRFDYVSNIAKAGGMFAEYDFLDGNVLLRLSHDLTPTQEKQYEQALQKILGH